MRVYKCDRCGFVYYNDPLGPEDDLHIETSRIFGLQKDSIDLCPTCAMDFKDFMSAKWKKGIEYEKNLQSMRKNV